MPQLDIITFFMQIFFTFLSFWLSFISYRNWVLPEAYIVLKQRQTFISFIITVGIFLSSQFLIIKLYNLKLITSSYIKLLILSKDLKYNIILCNVFFKVIKKFKSLWHFTQIHIFNIVKLNNLTNCLNKINITNIYNINLFNV